MAWEESPVTDELRYACGPIFPRTFVKGTELFSPVQRLLSEHQAYDVIFKAPSLTPSMPCLHRESARPGIPIPRVSHPDAPGPVVARWGEYQGVDVE